MPQSPPSVSAIRVRQWLRTWNDVEFDPRERRRKPEPDFFLLSMDAALLRRLADVRRRETREAGRTDPLAIQRRHDPSRSLEIGEYVKYGFPWSELSPARRGSGDYRNLRKPGWLPTAIVVNILLSTDKRGDKRVNPAQVIRVEPGDRDLVRLSLPPGCDSSLWRPQELAPIEVIDGQHRLWAFDRQTPSGPYELPVVAFHGLDISWQAYLFYTINIKPKRINRSLAYDLYPLLRTEDWLEGADGVSVYRETRAQELTEVIWAHPSSLWHSRINMLGEPGRNQVTQASWIRSLLASFVRGPGRGKQMGGLFATRLEDERLTLTWTRAQQAAYLLLLWSAVERAVTDVRPDWCQKLGLRGRDAIFADGSLLNSDQGVRVVLQVFNDLSVMSANDLRLFDWSLDQLIAETIQESDVTQALVSARNQPFATFLEEVAADLVRFDWRSSSAPGLEPEERLARMAYRGNGGYGELRRQVLESLRQAQSAQVAGLVRQLVPALR